MDIEVKECMTKEGVKILIRIQIEWQDENNEQKIQIKRHQNVH